jgi:iron(III) transport system permease protein
MPLARAGHGEAAGAGAAAAVLLLAATFVVWPVARVLWLSVSGPDGVTLARYRDFFVTERLVRSLVNTLAVSAVSTALTVTLALVLAWAATRTTVPGKRFLSLVSLLPLVSPPFLVSLGLILLLGRDGAITRAFGLDWSIHGFHGIVVAQVFTFLPRAYVVLADVLGSVDTALEEAAESLGAGALTTLRRVTLSLARPGLASAALVVFILCMADFGNPLLIGGRTEVLATEIYAQAIRMKDVAAAATTSVVLVVPCLAAYLVNASAIGRRSRVPVSTTARTALRPTPPPVRWPLFLLSGGLALAIVAIYAVIPLGSLVSAWGSDWSLTAAHYGLESTAEGAWPIWNSVKLAAASGVAGTVLALLAAYVVERKRAAIGTPVARALEFLALLPAALPGTVLGVGYVLAFGAPPLALTGTLAVLAASVVFWKLPVAVRAGVHALQQIDPAIEEAAVSLGAGSVRTFARVVLPLLTGTALSIFAYFFIGGMVTVSAVIFLVHPGFDLGSVAILTRVASGDLGAACALGTSILAIAIGTVLALRAVAGDRTVILKSGAAG